MQTTLRTQQVNAGTRLGSCGRPACGRPLRASTRRAVRVVVRAEGGNKPGTQRLKLNFPKEGTGVGGLLGTIQRSLGSITQSKPSAAKSPAKDARTVFVAGATGRTGVRIVRELLDAGFKVRAGARDVEGAQANAEIAVKLGLLTQDDLKRLSFQEFDLTDPEGMAGAMGNATKVVCAVGAAESSLDPGAPKRIDGDGTIALIREASKAGVEQFVLVSSLGTGKVGFPAAILNLFWGVLLFKRQAEVELEKSGMSYCIVRPGGMERPTDTYKRTHNLVLKPRDSIFGGQVSRLQVAELVASTLVNPDLAENKVLEVVAETSAPALSFEELLQSIPGDISRSEQLAANEELDAIRAELAEFERAVAQAQEALELESEKVTKLQAAVQGAKANEKEVKTEAAVVLKEGKAAKAQLEKAEAALQRAQLEEAAAKAVLEAAKKAGQAGELLSKKEQQAVAQGVINPPKQKEEAPAFAAAGLPLAGLFGGSRATTPAPQKEEEEEVVVEAAKPAGLFGGLFSRPTSPVPQQVEEEEEEEEEEVVVEEPAKPAGLFGGLFGGSRAATPVQQVEEEEEEEEEVVVAEEEEVQKPAAGLFGGLFAGSRPASPAAAAAAPAAPAAVPKVEKPAAAPKAPEPEPEEAKPAGGLFASLFGGAQTMVVGEDTKIRVPSAEPEEAPKPKPVAAAAAPAPAAGPRAPAPPPFDAAEAKRKAVLEEAKAALEREQAAAAERQRAQEEEERIKQSALAAAAEERAKAEAAARAKKEAEEKARAEAEAKAKAEAAAKAKAEAEARAKAEEEARAKLAAEMAQKEADARAAAEAEDRARAGEAAGEEAAAPAEEAPTRVEEKAPAAAAVAPKEEVPANVAEARAWIANWKKKQGKASSSSSSSSSQPSSSSSSSGGNGVPTPKEDVAPNVAEAREWIARWKAKQAGESGDEQAADGEVTVEEPPFANVLNKLFGFGKKE